MTCKSIQSIFKYPSDTILFASHNQDRLFVWPPPLLQKLLVCFLHPFSSSLKHIRFDEAVNVSREGDGPEEGNSRENNGHIDNEVLPSEPSLE
jgi:hypothetical protein